MSLVGLSGRELTLVSVALLLPLTALAASGFGASIAHNARTGLASLVPGGDEGSFSTGESAEPASADASSSDSGRTHGQARLFGRSDSRTGDLVGGASRLTSAEGASGSTGARGESSPETRSEGTSDNGSGTATGDSGSSGAEPSGVGDGASTSDAAGARGVTGSATGPGVTVTVGGSESGVTLSAKDEDNGIGGGVTAKDQSPDGGISVDVTSDSGSSSGSGARVPSTGVSVP